MKRVSTEDEFLRWKQSVDSALRQLQQGRNLGTKQADRFQVGLVVFFTEELGDGSVNIYVKHAHAPSGNRLLLGNVTKG
jgi:hypothetical protein